MKPAAEDQRFALSVTLRDGYAFTVDFGQEGMAPLLLDEPPPLGGGRGPNPARLLGAAIGSCLGASLLFCLRKSRIDVARLRVSVEGRLVRNPQGRLRIGGMKVLLSPEVPPDQRERMSRCLDLFEDFCIVTQSVRRGIDIDVDVAGVPVASTGGREP